MKRFQRTVVCLFSLLLIMLMSGAVFAADEPVMAAFEEIPGTITGQVFREGGMPFGTGFVAFFTSENLDPMDYGTTRRSPKMIAFLDESGKFTTAIMAPGSYYIGAMERQKWRGGPPRKNEKRFSAFDEKGEYRIVTLENGQNLDIGHVVVKEPGESLELTKFFTISGRLLDKDGKGIPDAVVVVKQDYNDPKGGYVSGESSFNGHYEIKLPPGKYYLIARETVAGSMRPKPGTIYGELGHNEPIGIGGKGDKPATFINGALGQEYTDVDIRMFRVPIPEVKRKETEELVKADKYKKADLSENLPLMKKPSTGSVKSEIKAVGEKKEEKSEK